MNKTVVITPSYLADLEKSILESEAYKNKFKSAKASLEKNREMLVKHGILSK